MYKMGDTVYVELSDTYSELWFIPDSKECFGKCCKIALITIIVMVLSVMFFVYIDKKKETFDFNDSIDYVPLPVDYKNSKRYRCHEKIRSKLKDGYIRPFNDDKPKDKKRVKWSDSLVMIKRI